MTKNRLLEQCPNCGCRDFTSDWSQLDKRDLPIILEERYKCSDCGRVFVQAWKGEGWEKGEMKGKSYVSKCLDCNCEDLGVQRSDLQEDVSWEKYRCDKCGAEHYQVWRATGWHQLESPERPDFTVIGHERAVLEEEDEE